MLPVRVSKVKAGSPSCGGGIELVSACQCKWREGRCAHDTRGCRLHLHAVTHSQYPNMRQHAPSNTRAMSR